MSKKRKTIIGILVFIIFIAIAGSAYDYFSKGFDSEPALTKSSKTPAFNFTVTDNDGNEVMLSDYFGKPIILNFWASWCSPCQREMPHFNTVYGELKDEINFFMVNIGETTENGKAYIAKNQFAFPVFFDEKQEAANVYGITAIPKTYFIDKDGNIVSSFEGTLDEESLLERIELIR